MALDERLLDDPHALADADPSGALRALAGAGAQIRTGITLAREAGMARLGLADRPRSVLVASLGGSAVVGEVLTMLTGSGAPVPVSVRRGLPLPGWVGPLDLVIGVSMSGRAPGPLGLVAEAARRGCSVMTVGAADSPLAAVTERTRGVHVPVGPAATVAGRASRMAIWSLLTPLVLGFDALGLAKASAQVMETVADRLDEHAETYRPSSEAFVNPAKALALELSETMPVLLADGEVSAVAASRAASMLARTARLPAMRGSLPDDAGDVVATFGGPLASRPEDLFADPFLDSSPGTRLRLLMLRDAPPEPGAGDAGWLDTARTADAVEQTAAEAGVRVSSLQADPGHPLARYADLTARTDFACVYLALGQGVDPVTSPHVADLRDRTR